MQQSHYNYYRYYQPQIGRYLRSDPIGLQGGLNLYLYAFNNTIGASDPKGLMGNWWPTIYEVLRDIGSDGRPGVISTILNAMFLDDSIPPELINDKIRKLEETINRTKNFLVQEHFDCVFDCDRHFPHENNCQSNIEGRKKCRSGCDDKYTRESEKLLLPFRDQLRRYNIIKDKYIYK